MRQHRDLVLQLVSQSAWAPAAIVISGDSIFLNYDKRKGGLETVQNKKEGEVNFQDTTGNKGT